MSREKKKGTSGNARAYITRTKALKKLQLRLPEFRRLCIVKGIYPRDPKKKVDGSDKTYYLRKDIDFLAHDRLIGTLRSQNAHKKKVVKARARREKENLRQLAVSAPKTRLDHVVLERYPSFGDALREIDDPLCIVALFSSMPANNKYGITARKANLCKRLLNEFHHYVAQTGALRKVFVSIKGYYYQAVIQGEIITWMTPHRFTQVLPKDVDYSVMLTFLDLYKCILSFVNFKLYSSENLVYPPKFSRDLLNTALELGAVVDEDPQEGKPEEESSDDVQVEKPVNPAAEAVAEAAATMAAVEDESDDEEEEKDEAEEEDDGEDDEANKLTVFKGCSVVIGRETPFNELEFVLKAAGVAKVTREDDLPEAEGPERLEGYTHWICDRPSLKGGQNMTVEYIQPQYVFDSVNTGVLLPASLYNVGRKLPPHLSPFVAEDADGGYRPWYKDILERIKAGDESVAKEAAAVIYEQEKAQKIIAEKEEADSKEMEVDTEEDGKRTKNNKKKRKRSKEEEGDTVEGKKDTEVVEGEESQKKKKRKKPANKDALKPTVEDEEMDDSDEENEEEGKESESDESDDEDSEKENEGGTEAADKDLAKVMLSRKKMRKYQHIMREQNEQKALKEKLTAKRRAIEAASKMNKTTSGAKKKKGRKVKN